MRETDKKKSKYIITFGKCCKGKEQIAMTDHNLVVTESRKANMAGVWFAGRE